jgi:hypothetical protein
VYRKLLEATGRVVGLAKKFSAEIDQGIKRASEVLHQARLQQADSCAQVQGRQLLWLERQW